MRVTLSDNPRLEYLRQKTVKLTSSPGCYIMKNKSGTIIYIGKAKNLRNRVSTYFHDNDHLTKVAKMVSNVYDYEFIVTDSEYEALVLESSLIKQHQPKYNILLKDDKGYSYIKISDEDFPRITKENQKKGSGTFIGPYTSGLTSSQTVEEVNRVFMLPTCKKVFPRDFKKSRPCLNFQIKRCIGLCRGCFSKDDYAAIIKDAIDYIKSGSGTSILPCTSSTEPVSATDAMPSLSTMPAEDTNSAVSSSATIDCFSTARILSERPDRYRCSALLAFRSRRVSMYS